MVYTKDTFKTLFQSEFNLPNWQLLLRDYFKGDKIRVSPEYLDEESDDREGYFLGSTTTADYYKLGFFYYKMEDGSVLRRKVGLRNLIKPYLKYGFDAALAVFDDGKNWRLSLICDLDNEATNTKRFTYVFGDKRALYKTPVLRFFGLRNDTDKFLSIRKAFSVDALSDDFFDEYRKQYAEFVKFLTGKEYVKSRGKWVEMVVGEPDAQFFSSFGENEKMVRDYIKKMMGRIVFLYFLQSKGWLAGNLHYMHDLFYSASDTVKDDFLDKVLEPMFFDLLNTKPEDRVNAPLVNGVGVKFIPQAESIPYLNGGLFQQEDIDEVNSRFPANMFKNLFDFFDSYNFTIDENDPNDAEVGVDPEMLGKIFENLLEDNKDKGAFYTPKEIVRYMCHESLIAYLQTGIDDEEEKKHIANFVKTYNVEELGSVSSELALSIDQKLKDVKICDPAIGSGAFPMGLLRELYGCRKAIEIFDADNAADIKRHIIQNNIYGVDIEKGAVDIARLRFWLALIIDEKEPMPLPNLDFKIMQGNSLLESYKGVDLNMTTKKVKTGKVTKKTSGVLSLGFEETDIQKTIQDLVKSYFSITDHALRAQRRKEIDKYVKDYIKICAEGNHEIQAAVDELEIPNDQFFLWHTYFHDVFENGGFDIVIGNPPYIKEYENKAAFNDFRECSPYYMGKMDLWYGFACSSIDILKTNGILCFIATNNWVTNAGAFLLRNKIIIDTQILQMIDFGNYMVFEDSASIQTMIMLFSHSKNKLKYKFDYRKLIKSKPVQTDANNLLISKEKEAIYLYPQIDRKEYINKTFTFNGNDKDIVLSRMVQDADYLNKNEATNGIHPHYDFVNKKIARKYPEVKIGEGIFGLSKKEKENLNLTSAEKEIVKPYYNSKQVKRYWTLKNNSEWLIYTDSSYKNEQSMNSFPHLKAHLDRFKDIITSDNKPYGLHRAREERFFKGEKIVSLRKCVGRPSFSYSNFNAYVSATFYVIKTDRYDMKYLTGLLNSKLIAFWLRYKGKMQGDNFQIDKEPLMQIPLKRAKNEKTISYLVNSIIKLIEENNSADTNSLENQIDFLVYHLYDLTYDEVLIVDPNPPFTREQYESGEYEG